VDRLPGAVRNYQFEQDRMSRGLPPRTRAVTDGASMRHAE